ncbi:hypothetical protein L3Q72_18800 [Vibrio sp. JC009]|uniref:hypothetical protein n=1 Tax=Vibrio sp. JC009 TaxID=2912314 RepID=UPI0023AFE0ED|nr:hypothetical protein [Vibrio sp. JC009]WED24925.1 hypothetical protein L3Q72_18800 [Vibrio sp. JC009]
MTELGLSLFDAMLLVISLVAVMNYIRMILTSGSAGQKVYTQELWVEKGKRASLPTKSVMVFKA